MFCLRKINNIQCKQNRRFRLFFCVFRFFLKKVRKTFEKTLKKIASKYNKTPAQISLRFLTQRGVSVVPKSKHELRLKENIDIFDFHLTEEEINQIRQIDQNDTLFSWTKNF